MFWLLPVVAVVARMVVQAVVAVLCMPAHLIEEQTVRGLLQ
jgi:hypothetical protein